MRLYSVVLCFAWSAVAFAQLDPYTVTITASRSLRVQPDQASIIVIFETDLTMGLDDVVSALQGSGVSASNLSSVSTVGSTNSAHRPANDWVFALSVPLTNLDSSLAALTKLQETTNGSNASNLSFSVQGTQISPELQASQQCPVSGLMADARSQAATLAQAAGFGLGPVLALSDGSQGSATTYAAYRFAAIVEPFLPTTVIGGFTEFVPPVSRTCTIVVKFSLIPNV